MRRCGRWRTAPCARATGELFEAKEEVDRLILGSGHKAAVVEGRLYMAVPVDDGEDEELLKGFGIPMGEVLVLDAKGGVTRGPRDATAGIPRPNRRARPPPGRRLDGGTMVVLCTPIGRAGSVPPDYTTADCDLCKAAVWIWSGNAPLARRLGMKVVPVCSDCMGDA